jgi:hypothetical protein
MDVLLGLGFEDCTHDVAFDDAVNKRDKANGWEMLDPSRQDLESEVFSFPQTSPNTKFIHAGLGRTASAVNWFGDKPT